MRFKIILFTGLGFLFLAIGAIGVFLPVLPTTPFILLSAYFFTCSPALKAKIMKIAFFKEYIENYDSRKGLSRKTVISSLSYLWIMLLLSMLLIKIFWIIILLFIVGISVTIHILHMAKGKQK